MSVLVTLKNPDNTISKKFYRNAEAHITPHGILQVIRYDSVIAQFHPNSFLFWEYALTESSPEPTSRAGSLLRFHEQ